MIVPAIHHHSVNRKFQDTGADMRAIAVVIIRKAYIASPLRFLCTHSPPSSRVSSRDIREISLTTRRTHSHEQSRNTSETGSSIVHTRGAGRACPVDKHGINNSECKGTSQMCLSAAQCPKSHSI